MGRWSVLVVDDEPAVRESLCEFLEMAGHEVRAAATGEQAETELRERAFDVVLLDVVLPDISGWDVLQRFRGRGEMTPVVMLSASSSTGDSSRAVRQGATDVLAKPFDNVELEEVLQRAVSTAPSSPPDSPRGAEAGEARLGFVGRSTAMTKVVTLMQRIAGTDVPVLLWGESGTGKDVVAREIHRLSARRAQSFIKVSCLGISAELLESELERAHQGTIFLDEIGELSIGLQAKLLQGLQDSELFHDARVIAATHRELEREIEQGKFREDLYYRLNVVAIRVPPLRERRDDLVPLIDHFLEKHNEDHRHGDFALSAELLKALRDYDWPGNVRELENMVRRMVVLNEPSIALDELRIGARGALAPRRVEEKLPLEGTRAFNPFAQPQPPPPPMTIPLDQLSLKDIGKRAAMLAEREAILAMLQRTAWNKRKAASKLRISYKALLYKIKESGIIDPRVVAEV